jgi:peptidoglycan/LPS O-acetylase OafA/YrhL
VAGLRAVAVGLVLLFHAGLPFIPGGFVGVDVFFVISGFLITGQLVTEIDRTGRISLVGFYGRRAKRILPAASAVLVVTAALTWFLIPRDLHKEVGLDIAGAAAYVVNWRLADRSVDYMAQDSAPSPVQHYWSLAVEEQFYLLWPLLIIAAIVVTKAVRRRNVRPILWIGLAAVAVPSFAWSVMYTASAPERAFFVSTTRMWELAVGAGLALMAASLARIPRGAAIVMGWLGLLAIVVSALLVTEGTAWPGYAAALPTLGAAAVIAAGAAAGPRGPIALLGTGPFRWVGELSYSLYLWHWPLVVLAAIHWNGLSPTRGLIVVVASVVPAWITYRLVESPLRYSRAISGSARLALGVGGVFTATAMCAGMTLVVAGAVPATPAAGGTAAARGAAVLLDLPAARPIGPVPDRFDFITPEPRRAPTDVPAAPGCMQSLEAPELQWCSYGDPKGTKVAIVGDSKMQQWLPAFRMLADQNGWNLVAAFKAGCPFSSANIIKESLGQPDADCTQWNGTLLRRLVDERPDYLVSSQTTSTAADDSGRTSVDAMVAGMRASWSALTAVGTEVIVLANNPGAPDFQVFQCVDKNRNNLSECSFDRNRHAQNPAFRTQQLAVAGQPGVSLIDLFDDICPTDRCPPVIGNVLIYRRGSHLTASYVKSLSPQLARALTDVGMPVRFTR